MVTGNKRAGVVDVRPHISARGASAAVIICCLTLLIAGAGWDFSNLPPLGIHQVVSNASWKEECSSCHMEFPPSLLPAESWKRAMAGLSDHFGEDASLPEGTVAEIEQFLVANAAETQDSLPAHRFSKVDANRPLEITATPVLETYARQHSPQQPLPANPLARRRTVQPVMAMPKQQHFSHHRTFQFQRSDLDETIATYRHAAFWQGLPGRQRLLLKEMPS